VWGIGRQNAARLDQAHVLTAWDLAQCPTEWARRQLGGVVGVRLVKELRGEPCLGTQLLQEKKNIACTQSFGKVVTRLDLLQEAIVVYATRAAEKLRSQGSVAGAITVFAHTNRHSAAEQYYRSYTTELPVASDSTLELAQAASAAIKRIFKAGFPFAKAGVMLSDLVPREGIQADLFKKSTALEHRGLMHAMDLINSRWGSHTVTVAASGKPQEQEWQMLRQMRSPRYTTHLEEILHVNC